MLETIHEYAPREAHVEGRAKFVARLHPRRLRGLAEAGGPTWTRRRGCTVACSVRIGEGQLAGGAGVFAAARWRIGTARGSRTWGRVGESRRGPGGTRLAGELTSHPATRRRVSRLAARRSVHASNLAFIAKHDYEASFSHPAGRGGDRPYATGEAAGEANGLFKMGVSRCTLGYSAQGVQLLRQAETLLPPASKSDCGSPNCLST